jgi:hypothetical protein
MSRLPRGINNLGHGGIMRIFIIGIVKSILGNQVLLL